MGPGLGIYASGGLLLDPVVAHRGGGVERLVDVARFEEVALLGGVRPDAGEAVGLELEPDRERVGLTGSLLLARRTLPLMPEQVLHVMADLVGET